ncbi:MAG: sigma-70 family RNA polymerase sigma factor [Anaerolineae bacterium]|nr:sigma-70 family RNA polymerase sigma factor [Anaerolineae bacterium]
MQQDHAVAALSRPLPGLAGHPAKAHHPMLLITLPDLNEDDQLLAAARRGSPAALSAIFESYFEPVFSFIRLRVDDAALAEDLASEVFVRLVTVLRQRRGPRSSLRGWLFQVARNLVNDHYRARKGFTESALDEWLPGPQDDDPELHAIRAATAEQTRRALRTLPPEQQEVLILRFAQSLSLQETAELMGKQANAIKQLQFRAIQALRRALAPSFTEPEHG